MQISEIKIRKIIGGNERLKAIVSITLDDSVAVHDIKVISGNDRLFFHWPVAFRICRAGSCTQIWVR